MRDTTDPTDADTQAILAVLHAETQAFVDADFEAWSQFWVRDDRLQSVQFSPAVGLAIYDGWDTMAAETKHVLDHGLGCRMTSFGQENMRLTVKGDTAWAVYDQWAVNVDNVHWRTVETRILERGEEGWRIVYASFMVHSDQHIEQGALALDSEGRLLRAGPDVLEALKSHDLFTVSAGRLRARRRDWDKALQEALAQAGQYHGFFQLRRFAEETGGPFRYPAILGPTDDGGVAVAHLSVRDGVTLLQLDGDRQLDRRLKVAQAVYGLSDGQLRVARHIANGDGMAKLADALDISVNTARTHLTRLYEKTGVSSQTALVRLLLSVGG